VSAPPHDDDIAHADALRDTETLFVPVTCSACDFAFEIDRRHYRAGAEYLCTRCRAEADPDAMMDREALTIEREAVGILVAALWDIIQTSTDQRAKAIAAQALKNAPMICEDCEQRVAVAGEELCPGCRDNRAEAAYEHSLGECFRGNEAAAYDAEQQDKARRLK